jgi:hypothetical protein
MPLNHPANPVWRFQTEDDDPFHKPSTFPLKLLAEGDSWFSMNAIPSANLLEQLRFDNSNIIVNCAKPGDTIRNLVKMRNDNAFQLEAESGIEWNAILLSGGGNDVIDDARWIIPASTTKQSAGKAAQDYCDTAQLKKTLDLVIDGYEKLLSIRDGARSSCKNAPVLIHTYDYATPRNSPAQFFDVVGLRGPWLYPAMLAARIAQSEWNAVSDFILGSLAARLLKLHKKSRNITVVNTLGTLDRAALGTIASSNDWVNEIHPSRGGYAKVAGVLSPVLAGLL